MLLGREQSIEVWRLTTTSGIANWGDPTWAYSHSFNGVVQPFDSNEGLRNSQRFANVRHIITCPVDTDIQDEDELVITSKYDRYARVLDIEPFDNGIIPHLMVYVSDSQWDRTV